MYVHFSTVYNREDLEPTQMPTTMDCTGENMAHIHHGILCSHKKRWVCVLCRDMDESGNRHSQQIDTRTENQTPHVLTQTGVEWWEHMVTGRGASHTGVCWWWLGEGQQGVGSWGGITWGEMPDIGDGDGGSKPACQVCTYATILHFLHMYPRTI